MYSGEMWYHEMTWDQGLWRNSTLSNEWIYTPTGRAVVFRTQRLQVRILLDPPLLRAGVLEGGIQLWLKPKGLVLGLRDRGPPPAPFIPNLMVAANRVGYNIFVAK